MKAKSPRRNAQIMTRQQIYARYPSQWILVADPISDKDFNLVRGRVIFHSKDRDSMYRAAIKQRPARFATLFTGKPRQDMEFVL